MPQASRATGLLLLRQPYLNGSARSFGAVEVYPTAKRLRTLTHGAQPEVTRRGSLVGSGRESRAVVADACTEAAA